MGRTIKAAALLFMSVVGYWQFDMHQRVVRASDESHALYLRATQPQHQIIH